MTNHRTLKALIPAAAGLLCVALLNVPSAQAAPRNKQVGTTTGTNSTGGATAANDIKIGNRSQFVQSASPSPKATTATRGRPQRPAFRPERVFIH